MRSSFRPALVLMTGRSLGFLVTFFIPVVLSRMFTRAEFGTYKQAFLVFATLYSIAQLGMAESLFYFLPSRPKQAGSLVANAMAILATSGAACVAVLLIVGSGIGRHMHNPDLASCLLPVGLYLVLTMSAVVLEIVMIAHKRHRTAAISYAVSECARAALFLVPVLLFGRLAWLFWGAVLFAALRLAATVWYLGRQYGNALRPDAALLRQQLRYALPFALAVLVEMVHTNLHQYVVSFHFDAATFAVYSVGILQIPIVDFLATPASSVMMVAMSDTLRDGRPNGVLDIWHDTTRKLALVFFPMVGLFAVSSPEIIRLLFTERYAASIPLFAVWSTTILLAAFQTDGVLRVYAATRGLLLLNLLKLGAVLLLLTILIPLLQLEGAVLATVAASFVARGAGLIAVRRLIGVGASALLPWRSLAAILGASLLSAVVAFAVRSWLPLPILFRLAVTGLAFSACYFTLLFRGRILRPEERLALTSWTAVLAPSVKAEQTP